jgi:hypothetical protein
MEAKLSRRFREFRRTIKIDHALYYLVMDVRKVYAPENRKRRRTKAQILADKNRTNSTDFESSESA